jgi:GTP cyclohydrolase I
MFETDPKVGQLIKAKGELQNERQDKAATKPAELPDVASKQTAARLQFPLSRVGMSHIQVPIIYGQAEATDVGLRASADVDAYVSLDQSEARGIHMSRLFTLLHENLPERNLSVELLQDLTAGFLESHQALSQSAEVFIRWPLLLKRKALKSENFGWRSYPVAVFAEQKNNEFHWGLEFQVLYSSTCPASAALSRDLIQNEFKKTFTEENVSAEKVQQWLASPQGMKATPHAQRSIARVKLVLAQSAALDLQFWINQAEEVLQTPVQTAVKRADEQEFAARNGQNLMFCEDANRRIQASFQNQPQVFGYQVEVRHLESLHPHDAVSLSRAGFPSGDFLLNLPQ